MDTKSQISVELVTHSPTFFILNQKISTLFTPKEVIQRMLLKKFEFFIFTRVIIYVLVQTNTDLRYHLMTFHYCRVHYNRSSEVSLKSVIRTTLKALYLFIYVYILYVL